MGLHLYHILYSKSIASSTIVHGNMDHCHSLSSCGLVLCELYACVNMQVSQYWYCMYVSVHLWGMCACCVTHTYAKLMLKAEMHVT